MKIKPLTANLPPGPVRFFSFDPRLSVSSSILIVIGFLVSSPSLSVRVGAPELIKEINGLHQKELFATAGREDGAPGVTRPTYQHHFVRYAKIPPPRHAPRPTPHVPTHA
jgi:hypothetical protein